MKTTDLKTSKELAAALEGAGYVVKPTHKYFPLWGEVLSEHELAINEMKVNSGLSFGVYVEKEPEFYIEKFNSEFGIIHFTMCELWEMLPREIIYRTFAYSKTLTCQMASYSDSGEGDMEVVEGFYVNTNPCNALARLCIWCIENGHPLNLEKKAV